MPGLAGNDPPSAGGFYGQLIELPVGFEQTVAIIMIDGSLDGWNKLLTLIHEIAHFHGAGHTGSGSTAMAEDCISQGVEW